MPDISGKPQRLDPNGDLRLPMVGRVHAAGMTIEQLEAELDERLKVYIQEPDVAVTVTEFHSQPVSVIGAVSTSGVHQLEGRKTLIEMLSLAGGVSHDAGPIVRIARRSDQGPIPLADAAAGRERRVQHCRNRSQGAARGPQPGQEHRHPAARRDLDPARRGGVRDRRSGQAWARPAERRQLDVGDGGGVFCRAARCERRRRARRESSAGPPAASDRPEVAVDLKLDDVRKSSDLPLAAGDILIVPDSPGKRAVTRVLEAAIQAGVIIGTYGIIQIDIAHLHQLHQLISCICAQA